MIESDSETENDALELKQISEFANGLPKPSKQTVDAHTRMMVYMEQLHDEIRSKHRDFMPPYDPSTEQRETGYELAKYGEHEYSLGSHTRAD